MVDATWLDTALQVTGSFETDGDPWSDVTGNFDAEGISCGVLQWNIGQGSLQPMVKAAGLAEVSQCMPQYGAQLWQACNALIPNGLNIVRSWQINHRLNPAVEAELRAFMGCTAMKNQQRLAVAGVAQQAEHLATTWAQAARTALPTLHEFCWFFDLVTQNGGLKGLTYADVQTFISQHAPGQAVAEICAWLGAVAKGTAGWRDARKNSAAWVGVTKKNLLDLLVLSYLRVQKSRPEWRYDAMNRKGAIAVKFGTVHGEALDFTKPPVQL
jgi:hypothetical protein